MLNRAGRWWVVSLRPEPVDGGGGGEGFADRPHQRRIRAGTIDEHLPWIAEHWIHNDGGGHPIALVASTNRHVDTLNAAVQTARITASQFDPDTAIAVGGGEHACIGDVIAMRHSDRRLVTTAGQPVLNRELWTVTATRRDGSLTVPHTDGHGRVVLPADYLQQHVRLGYAATEPGYQSDTVTIGIEVASTATTRRVLCVQDHDVALVSRPQRPGRCQILDWFDPLLDHTRHELVDLEPRAVTSAATCEASKLTSKPPNATSIGSTFHLATTRQLAAAEHDLDDAKLEDRRYGESWHAE